MKKIIAISFLAFFAVFIIFLTGCDQQAMGIFYSIEKESVLQPDKGLDASLKVWKMAKDSSNYYIAAGNVYTRTASSDWSPITAPTADMLSSDIVSFNGTIYAVFRSSDGATSKLYKLVSSSWSGPIDISGESGERIAGIMQVGNALFVEKYETTASDAYYPYTLWYTTDGTTFQQASITDSTITSSTISDITIRQIFDGAYDGSTYWFITGDTIYSGSSPASITRQTIKDTGGNTITCEFGGIFYSAVEQQLFLTDKTGIVYVRDTTQSTNWFPSGTVSTDSVPVVFYDMEEMVTDVSGSDQHFLLIGSDGGYYQLQIDSIPFSTAATIDNPTFTPETPGVDSTTSTANYLNTDLSSASIRKFFVDNAGSSSNIVFACTTGNGLWRNKLEPDTVSGSYLRVWNRE